MSAINTTNVNAAGLDLTKQNNAGKVVSQSSSSLDKDAFLKLLAAQAKTQDPMNPSDSTQQIAQLAQFSSLEQMLNVSNATQQSQAVQMIGHKVTYSNATTGQTITGTVESVTMSSSGPTLKVDGVSGITLKSVGVVE